MVLGLGEEGGLMSDERSHEETPPEPLSRQEAFVRWIPIAVPFLALLLLFSAFLIEADVLSG